MKTGPILKGVTLAAAAAALAEAAIADPALERGAYLARIMDCAGCHTPSDPVTGPDHSRDLSGGSFGFALPGLGVFYPSNLTSDRETGLGDWSEDDIVAALTEGMRPDGRALAPVMPWRQYAGMTDGDARALARWLKSLAPIANATPGPFGPDERPTAPYLAMVIPE